MTSTSERGERGVASGCAHIDEVEDMVLGLLDGPARRRIGEHLASCAECREARADFEDERALFAARAPAIEAPRELSRAIETAVTSEIASRGETRGRVIHGVFAAVACAAALAFATNLSRLHEPATSAPRVDRTSTADVQRSEQVFAQADYSASPMSRDEPEACFAASTMASRLDVFTASDAPQVETLASGSHAVSRALCEP